jgi:hypothetical protein
MAAMIHSWVLGINFSCSLILVTRGANVHGKKSGNLAALIILPEASLE